MGYFLGLFIGAIWILSMAYSDIEPKVLNRAIDVCVVNGGIEKFRSESTGIRTAYCKNGAKFRVDKDDS